MNMSKLTEWEELLIAVGSKLAWFNHYICQGNQTLLDAVVVEIAMDMDSYERLSKDEYFLDEIRASILSNGSDFCYDIPCSYAFTKANLDTLFFANVLTKFSFWGNSEMCIRVTIDPLVLIPYPELRAKYLSVLT